MARQKEAVSTGLADVSNDGLINIVSRYSRGLYRSTTGENPQVGRRYSRETASKFAERSTFTFKKIDILEKSTAA